jgi:hypothetical protein
MVLKELSLGEGFNKNPLSHLTPNKSLALRTIPRRQFPEENFLRTVP